MKTNKQRRGVALITVLAAVTAISIILLAYLATSRLDRMMTVNYFHSLKSDELAVMALQEIIGDLQSEIEAGSKQNGNPSGANYTFNGIRIYVPSSNKSIIPARIGFEDSDYGTDPEMGKLPPSLIRVSRSAGKFSFLAKDYTANFLPPNRVSDVSTADPAVNGRKIAMHQWNKPLILSADENNLPSPFKNAPPEWVYVTKKGGEALTRSDLEKKESKGVLGRYAYVIYDQGGLLDVNVAGYPSTEKDSREIAGKSHINSADLTQIPGLNSEVVNKLFHSRNAGGIQKYKTYPSLIPGLLENGFLKYLPGDNPLLTRQDLIGYFKNVVKDTKAVPYLGTFTRALTAPSWGPTKNSSNPSYAYLDSSENSMSNNRNLANLRGKNGKLFLKKRFPLSRIELITHTETASKGSKIHNYFGLSRSSATSSWTYDHGDSRRILSLDEVAKLDRDPDFFELLKAGILNGSVGQHPGIGLVSTRTIKTSPVGVQFEYFSSIADSHLIQIGANIIDQYDTDPFPTAIYFNSPLSVTAAAPSAALLFKTALGIENLPYLTRLGEITFEYDSPTLSLGGWWQPELWNPHQTPLTAIANQPTQFRVKAYGQAKTDWDSVNMPSGATFNFSPTINYDSSSEPCQYIYFNTLSGTDFRNAPVFLTTGNITQGTTALNLWQSTYTAEATVNRFAGIYTGTALNNCVHQSPKIAGVSVAQYIAKGGGLEASFSLEYSDGSNWYPYTMLSRIQRAYQNDRSTATCAGESLPRIFVQRVDPRTDRFTVSTHLRSAVGISPTTGTVVNSTIQPNSTTEYYGYYHWPRANPGNGADGNPSSMQTFTYTNANKTAAYGEIYYASWLQNVQGTRDYYSDPDGIVRPADGYRKNASTGDGCLLYINGPTDARRPVILNRPFYSVAEMGYAYRDLPFKSIDFWSSKSADAALLDLFCIDEEPEVVAGEIEINTASNSVIRSILVGASKKEIDTASKISASEAKVIAAAISQYVLTTPLQNRADLVTELSDTLQSSITSSADKANKALAEAPIRALSGVTNTRTWNLLIDVFAQSGKLSPTASTLKDFVIEGEKHYWLHVAIDRFTGKIVDQQWEAIYD